MAKFRRGARNATARVSDHLGEMPRSPILDDRAVEALFSGRSNAASGDDLIDLEGFVDAVRFETLEHPQPSAALSAVLRSGVEVGDPVRVARRRRERELQLITGGKHLIVAELQWIVRSWWQAVGAWRRIGTLHASAVFGLRAFRMPLPAFRRTSSFTFGGGHQSGSIAFTAAGYMLRVVLVSVLLLAMTMSAAVAGVLPTTVQRTVATAVSSITPFELPEVSLYGRIQADANASPSEPDTDTHAFNASDDQVPEQAVVSNDAGNGRGGGDDRRVADMADAERRGNEAASVGSDIAAERASQGHGPREPEAGGSDVVPPGFERRSSAAGGVGSRAEVTRGQESSDPGFARGQGSGNQGSGQSGQSGGQGSGNQGSGNQGSGNQGSGNQGSGQSGQSGGQGSGNQGSGNQGSGNQGSGQSGQSGGQGSGNQGASGQQNRNN